MSVNNRELIQKLVLIIISTLTTVCLGFTSFTLSEAYRSKLILSELQIKQTQVELKIEKIEQTPSDVKLLNQKIDELDKDLCEIKSDIKDILSGMRK